MPKKLVFLAPVLLVSGCFSSSDLLPSSGGKGGAHINNKTKFSVSAYGVAASPRVTTSRNVRKGGGRRQVGRPYKIKGKWYYPKEEPGYDRVGQASWYGPNFHGRLTANGEVYDQYALSGAHPTFPLPSYARVTNLKTGKSVVVRVNDRGPYHEGRIIDLSAKASELLGYQKQGVARVRVQYIGQAPLHGRDHKYLISTYRSGGAPSSAVAYRRPPDTHSSPVGLRRPGGMIRNEMLDPMSTGSVSESDTSLDSSQRDPFIEELGAVKQQKDTGSTLALRLREFFRRNGAR